MKRSSVPGTVPGPTHASLHSVFTAAQEGNSGIPFHRQGNRGSERSCSEQAAGRGRKLGCETTAQAFPQSRPRPPPPPPSTTARGSPPSAPPLWGCCVLVLATAGSVGRGGRAGGGRGSRRSKPDFPRRDGSGSPTARAAPLGLHPGTPWGSRPGRTDVVVGKCPERSQVGWR